MKNAMHGGLVRSVGFPTFAKATEGMRAALLAGVGVWLAAGMSALAAISPAATIDTTTKGSWVGVYGAEGYVLLGFDGPSDGSFSADRTNLPSYITSYSTTYGRWLWDKASADTRALQDPTNTITRNAGCGYGGGTATITFTPNQTRVVKVGIYSVDWDSQGRSHTVSISGGGLSGTDSVSSFSGGQWNFYAISLTAGTPVVISVTYVAGTQGNSVVSAITFDPYVGPPMIQNVAATNVLGTSAWLNGNLSFTNGSPTSVSVYWDTTDRTTNAGLWAHSYGFAGTQPAGPLTYQGTDLNPGTTYWYAYAASNGYGVTWAQTSLTFRTLSGAISVTNGGFEVPARGSGGLTEPIPAGNGWSLIRGGSGDDGLWRPGGTTETLAPVEGSQYGYGYGYNGAASAVTLYQQVADSMLATRTYTLSVWVGDSSSYAFPGLVRLGLYNSTNNANGFFTATPLAVTNLTTTPGNGQGRYCTASFTTGGSPPSGPLFVGLGVSNGLDSAVRLAVFDDVTVTATVAAGSPPAIANADATNVLATSAWLNGTLTASNGAATYVSVYWDTNDWTTNSASWAHSNVFAGAQAEGGLAYQATGLSSNTTYWFAYHADSANGTTWAQPSRRFKTLGPPAVDNAAGATRWEPSSVVLNGTLTSGGSANVYIDWWTVGAGVTNVIDLGTPRTEGPFSTSLSGLAPSTRYAYRCVASNACGMAWAASAATFTTPLNSNGCFEIPVATTPLSIGYITEPVPLGQGWFWVGNNGSCGVWHPTNTVSPQPVEGVQYGYAYAQNSASAAATLYQQVTNAIGENCTYTLSVWVGDTTAYNFPGLVRVGLYNATNNAGGLLTAVPLAVTNISVTPGKGTGRYCTLNYRIGSPSPAGPLVIGLSVTNGIDGTVRLAAFDAVTLTVVADSGSVFKIR